MSNGYEFNWSDIAFGSKKAVKDLKATFIAAPRRISPARFKQLVKDYLPNGNIILGLAQEDYVLGFEDQPQFAMLRQPDIQAVITATNKAQLPHKIYTLMYQQRDTQHIIEKIPFSKVVFINGSWKHSFHTLPIYYALINRKQPFELVSAFADEQEAKETAKKLEQAISKKLSLPPLQTSWKEAEMVALANKSAQQSFDHTFQTGAVVGKKNGSKYKLLMYLHNEIVPYQTFALHHGASREQFFSPPNDLNHYDTVHAEVQAVIKAMEQGIDLKGCTLFVNLLPCPVCSRVLLKSEIAEIIYEHDHSDGYAVKLLTNAGVRVRRAVG